METRQRPDIASISYSSQQISALADYIRHLNKGQDSLLDIFQQDTGRVFFWPENEHTHASDDQKNIFDTLTGLFRQSDALNFLLTFLMEWKTPVTETTIKSLRSTFMSYFLKPLKSSDVFKQLLAKTNQADSDAFYQQLLGAFVFKLTMTVREKYSSTQLTLGAKEKLLNSILNTIETPEQVIIKLKNKALKQFDEKISYLLKNLPAKNAKKHFHPNQLTNILDNTMSDPAFSQLANKEVMLWQHAQCLLMSLWLKQTPEYGFMSLDLNRHPIELEKFDISEQSLKLFTERCCQVIASHLEKDSLLQPGESNAIREFTRYLHQRLAYSSKQQSSCKDILSQLSQQAQPSENTLSSPNISFSFLTLFNAKSTEKNTSPTRSRSLSHNISAPELTPRNKY